MAKRRRRVPEVLWRLFHNRARTLADTIVSLIPSSPAADCRCKARRCLSCSGDGAMTFLIRPNDPSDYRKLLTRCFVVIDINAPPFLAFYPGRRWSQLEILERTIEMMMCNQSLASNVLCRDYDKHLRTSPAIQQLTASAWGLLLRRVGDGVMFYLLKHTSIFLPLPQKRQYQVSGFPVSDFCFKSKYITGSTQGISSFTGSGRKRKRGDEFDLNSGYFCGCVGVNCSPSFSRQCGINSHQKNVDGEAMLSTGVANANKEQEQLQNSNQVMGKPRKHQRQFSWQRRRKRRQMCIQEADFIMQHKKNIGDRDNSWGRLCSGFSAVVPFQCPCCLLLQTLPCISGEAQIDRQYMFYSLERSLSAFPRKHVLNSLKPNFSGANDLFKDIFGLSHANFDALSQPCSHYSNCCFSNYTCLYHSIIKLLKNLIRKAHNCQHLRLLEKHCAILPSLDQKTEYSSVLEANKSLTDSLQKGHDMICQDGKLLACKCSSLDINISEKDLETNCILFEPSQAYCLKKHVVSFIWAICRSIVPPDLLGTHSNWRTLRRNISRFVGLRRFEKYSLRQCLHKLKTSMFTVLSNRHALRNLNETKVQSTDKVTMFTVNSAIHTVNHKIVHYWIFWFFSHLVVPLVQANFYVTESEHGKQDLFYYRKSIWEMVMNKAIRHLEDQNYHSLTAASVRNIANKRSFGFSKVRLLPKENGVRVLANLKASSRIPVTESSLKVKPYQSLGKVYLDQKHVKYDYFKSVNSVLRDLHAVLRGLQMKEPDKLGSSVFDYNDVYRKLCPFLSALKNGSVNMPDIFIVVSDVSKAFDSINQDKLLNVVKDVTQNDEYLVKKSHQVVCAKNSLWVHQNLILANEDDGIGSNICTSSNRSLHGILVNQGWSRNIRKEELFFYLNEHLKHNVLQLDKNFYLQNVGIPQGSVLSSLLCSFYYGHLETNVIFPFLRKSEESGTEVVSGRSSGYNASSVSKAEDIPSPSKCLLLRLIDDFIFISTSKKQAASFFSRLQRGFQEYNCYMNKGKFGLNFDVDQISGCESNRMYIGEDGISFIRWSGLFINCCTLEVQADYTRYLKTHVSSSLTVYWQGKPGQHLKTRLCNYLRPKCHPIFYDSNINSAAVVRLNIYQAFLLCAMKFHCYVRDLSNIHQLDIKWYIVSIERSIRYMYKLIKKRMHFVEFDSTFRPIFQVERGEFEWLGLVAYTRILKRKQSRHKKLLSLLKAKLIAHEAKTTSSAMKYAVDDSHSSVFWKIRY